MNNLSHQDYSSWVTKIKEKPSIWYTIIFNEDNCNTLLSVKKDFINLETKKIIAEELGLLKKDEFHLTIIWSKTWDRIMEFLSNLSQYKAKNIIHQIKHILFNIQWKILLNNEFYYIKKNYKENWEIRESIIQTAEIENLSQFYEEINKILDLQFDVPFSHVTLFTNSNNNDKKLRGIWIYSFEDFQKMEPIKLE